MEKQRSFSMKPTKFLVFSLTVSSSLIFLTFFFLWVIKSAPSLHQETQFHLRFNNSNNSDLSPVMQALTDFSGDLSGTELNSSISTTNNFGTDGNISGIEFRDISISDAVSTSESKVTADDSNITTSFDAKFSSVHSVNYSVPVPAATHYTNLENTLGNGIPLDPISEQPHEDATSIKPQDLRAEEKNSKSGCDVTKGKWVFDASYPLYRNTTCPFIDEGFNCETNGRLDKDYMKWRWHPQDCDIPRFNATNMLGIIRGKRLVFVGDSLNRNQWESMLCMLMGAIKDPKKVYETRGRRITKSKGDYSFKFVDYKCTVEFYVTHFLVRESKAKMGKKRVQTLRIDTIDRGSSRWRGADFLVFNTAHWWSHRKTKAGINYYQEGDQIHPRLEVSIAFRRALATWASWVDKYVDPRRTRVFFRSSAPSHFSGGQWNTGGHCKEASQPTNATLGTSPVKNGIVEEVLRQMKTPVTYLSITGLSNYRIDGHPSIYGKKSEKSNSSGVQDCSHWCLPGVPDSWNELLYYHLLLNGTNSLTK